MNEQLRPGSKFAATGRSISALKLAYVRRRTQQRKIYHDGLSRVRRRFDYTRTNPKNEGSQKILGLLAKLIGSLYRNVASVLASPLVYDDPSTLALLRQIFDEESYLSLYPDVRQDGIDAWQHFQEFGLIESRNPNKIFDSSWYLKNYPDVRNFGIPAIIHYVRYGAKELRNPGPNFDAEQYVRKHREAKLNPLSHFLSRSSGATDAAVQSPRDSRNIAFARPDFASGTATITVIVPAYRGVEETRRCIESVMADVVRPAAQIIVVDDFSPEKELSDYLVRLAQDGVIDLIRNTQNKGFVASVNVGMNAAGSNDVVLLNSDTEVPQGWLQRLERQAYSYDSVGTVTPLSNNATICNYPDLGGDDIPVGYTFQDLDTAARLANSGLSVEIPTAVGFAMYIKRRCLDDVGMFDEETFGLGYGEENDFSLRATEKGWKHLLALDTLVYHKGEVSFGKNSPSRQKALSSLLGKFPNYLEQVSDYVALDPAITYRFATTAKLFGGNEKQLILLISHALGGGTQRHIDDLVNSCSSEMDFLLLIPKNGGYELSVPSLRGHAKLHLSVAEKSKLIGILKLFEVSRVHIHHVFGFTDEIRSIIQETRAPFDFTVHDYLAICPRITLVSPTWNGYCGEASEADCNSCISSGPEPISPARNIFEYRWRHRWLIEDAEQVICPSEDTKARLQRYGYSRDLTVVPHEDEIVYNSRQYMGSEKKKNLRIAILGGLAVHKGLALVKSTVIAARHDNFEFILIGSSDPRMKLPMGSKFTETGRYKEEQLGSLISEIAPDVFWFPSVCPETYSYTLSVALALGAPIIATSIGAFPERLRGVENSQLVSPFAEPEVWISAFESMRKLVGSQNCEARDIIDASY
ncbi:MAG: putative mycofactocin biosynthesis glycosyltransferase MftF [Nitrosomonadaceae bacterium]|nr:putative mycofactocin biosynthesis glycosyltransferase MftF [Nitrosomonadaceae bacterium]